MFRAAGFLTWRWGHKIWSPSSLSILNDMRHVSSSVAGDEQDSRSSREQQNFRNAAIAAVGTACLLGAYLNTACTQWIRYEFNFI